MAERRTERISVIIPAKNEERYLPGLLKDLREQRLKGRDLQIELETIVADAGSTDGTQKIARSLGARIIRGGMPGVGRNRGAKTAKGDSLVFLDSDVRLPDRRFLLKAAAEMERRHLDCTTAPNLPTREIKVTWPEWALIVLSTHISNMAMRLRQRTRRAYAIGTCIIARKKAFLDVGGFDERIYWGEDVAIIQDLMRKGYRFGILRSGRIYFSPRKAIYQGVWRYYTNVLRLDRYIRKKQITSAEEYRRIAKVSDYFAITKMSGSRVQVRIADAKKRLSRARRMIRQAYYKHR